MWAKAQAQPNIALIKYWGKSNVPKNIPAVIIGIGINVNQTQFPTDIKEIATSLKLETGEEINRTALIKQLITQLDFQYSELKKYKVETLITRDRSVKSADSSAPKAR